MMKAFVTPGKPEERNVYYCVLPVAGPASQDPRYLGRNLSRAAMEYVSGTVHGKGKTKDEALMSAMYARRLFNKSDKVTGNKATKVKA